jgi:hypothetical protein
MGSPIAERARRIIAVNLDGYEYSLAERMMAAGELPAMAALASRSARFLLDHGSDLRTGLGGEHVATGLSAEAAERWAAVHFDARTYDVWQQGTAIEPFPAKCSFGTVVFDPPYFDLSRAPRVRGIVSWGAHDPGVAPAARPASLWNEMQTRFGPYPATDWIYGTPWNSETRSKEMGDRLAAAVRLRTEIALWLFRERLPDWELALITVSEAHSAIEGLWHGIDEGHPLHDVPSSKVAGAGVREVYRAIDDFIDRLHTAFPDAMLIVFSMHGMGANGSDAPSMLLLAELLYRRAFRDAFHETSEFDQLPSGLPDLPETQSWRNAVSSGFRRSRGDKARDLSRRVLMRLVPKSLRASLRSWSRTSFRTDGPAVQSLEWMPATAYRRYWPQMPAFALPSFYDGRVRVNLKGREARGVVDVRDYEKLLKDLESLLRDCVDPISGQPVVRHFERPARVDPLHLAATEADLIIVWDNAPLGFVHPQFGRIGPIPYRRTGGHTGRHGFAYFFGPSIRAGDRGEASSYDVVSSIVAMLADDRDAALSGRNLLA